MVRFDICLLIIGLLLAHQAKGQMLKGRIIGENGEPVPNATIYIKELRQGTAANDDGQYAITLPTGNYSCIIRSMGYETVSKNVSIDKKDVTLDVTLRVQVYELDEVAIRKRREDPAYNIMRKAIAMAPYYRNQVKSYQAELYLKGSFHVIKISSLVKRMAAKEMGGFTIDDGMTFVEETVSEINFTAPNKYRQKVLSQTGNLPKQYVKDNILEMSTLSVYDPDAIEPYISPLSNSAFAHYRFTFEGSTIENGRMINKIYITPAHAGKQLFSGRIYIVNDFWNVYQLDVRGTFVVGGKFRMQLSFGDVGNNVWLPVSQRVDFNGSMLGNKGDLRYVSSMKYRTIEENTALRKPDVIKAAERQANMPAAIADSAKTEASQTNAKSLSPTQQRKQDKTNQKIEKILAKEELSNHEAYKLARLMRKNIEKSKPNALDLTKEIYDDYKVQVDSTAHLKDSAYWAQIRPVPLQSDELRGYVTHPAPRLELSKSDSAQKAQSYEISVGNTLSRWLFGGSIPLSKSSQLTYPGIIPSRAGFNTVDGFYLAQKLSYSNRFGSDTSGLRLRIVPEIAWAINRKALMWSVAANFAYAPLHRGFLALNFGHKSYDFAGQEGVYPLDNSGSSLFFRRNYAKLFDNRYISINNNIDIVNGLQLTATMSYEQREMLDNHSDFSLFYRDCRDFTPNIPPSELIKLPLEKHNSLTAAIDLAYTPRFYYRINRYGQKRMMRSSFPTFTVGYKRGIYDFLNSDSDFDLLTVGIFQNIDLGVMQQFRYNVKGGMFMRDRHLYFPDFKHFLTSETVTALPSGHAGYSLPGYYRFSTNRACVEAHATFTTPFLVLKYLPFIRDRLWNESLNLNYLYTPHGGHYIEAGYSLIVLMRVGVFVGCYEFSRWQAGLRVSVPLSIILPIRYN